MAQRAGIPGIFDPIPMPDLAWQHITMDFIEGRLPKSQEDDVIFVVVDRLRNNMQHEQVPR